MSGSAQREVVAFTNAAMSGVVIMRVPITVAPAEEGIWAARLRAT